MQNNFYGKQKVEVDGVTTELDRSNTTKFAFNLGGGITLPLSERSYLNAEAKFMFANDDNVVIMLGYGYKFWFFLGGLYVLLVLDGQHRGAHRPGEGRDHGDCNGNYEVRHAVAQGGADGYGQQRAGYGHEDVANSHYNVVGHAAVYRRQRAEQAAHDQAAHNGGLILADGLCDSGFGGAVGNTGENDTPFLQS